MTTEARFRAVVPRQSVEFDHDSEQVASGKPLEWLLSWRSWPEVGGSGLELESFGSASTMGFNQTSTQER